MDYVDTNYLREHLEILSSKDYVKAIQKKAEKRFNCKLGQRFIRVPLNFFLRNIILALVRSDEVHIDGYMHWYVKDDYFRKSSSKAFAKRNKKKGDTSATESVHK